MKKITVLLVLIAAVCLQYCSTSRQATTAAAREVTYTQNIQPLIQANCAPCHIPPKGNKEALHTYETAKANIDESIRRIQLNPGDKGFMPFKHPKMSDSTINVFVQWKEEGLKQ